MNTTEEIWKPVVGYEGVYEISSCGNVRRVGSLQLRKPQLGKAGYLMIMLCSGGVQKMFTVHRLVGRVFHGEPEGKLDCAHLDGNRLNNCAANLQWVTRTENHGHKKLHGTHCCGERQGNHRIKEADVHEMFRLRHAGVPTTKIAAQFNVARCTAFDVLRRVTWTHVQVDPIHLQFKHGSRWFVNACQTYS